MNRLDLLKKKTKHTVMGDSKTNFVFPYYPQLSMPSKIVDQFKKELFQDQESKKAFSNGFQVAFQRGKNLEGMLCRAKLWPVNSHQETTKVGWFPCNNCVACKHSLPITDKVTFYHKNVQFRIKIKLHAKIRM